MNSATSPESEPVTGSEMTLTRAVQDEGRTLMIVGGIVAVLGLLAIVFPVLSSVSIGLFFGAALVIAGFAHVAHAFSATRWTGAVAEVLLAIVFLFAGFGMLFNPVLALTSLTLLLVVYFLIEGAALLFFAYTLRAERSWVWGVGAAVLSFLLAGMVWVGFPSTAAWALGILFGAHLLGTGISMMVIGRSASKTAAEMTAATSQPGAGV